MDNYSDTTWRKAIEEGRAVRYRDERDSGYAIVILPTLAETLAHLAELKAAKRFAHRAQRIKLLLDISGHVQFFRMPDGEWHRAEDGAVRDVDTGLPMGRWFGPARWEAKDVLAFWNVPADEPATDPLTDADRAQATDATERG
jgi:hypothetical protein